MTIHITQVSENSMQFYNNIFTVLQPKSLHSQNETEKAKKMSSLKNWLADRE